MGIGVNVKAGDNDDKAKPAPGGTGHKRKWFNWNFADGEMGKGRNGEMGKWEIEKGKNRKINPKSR